MYHAPKDAGQSGLQRAADMVRRLHRFPARSKARRASQSSGTNAVASLGMIIGLLMVWAMAVNM